MPDLVLDAPTAVKNALAKLNALRPRVEELENVDANLAAAKSALKEAKDELVSVAAERDRTRTEYASARAELVALLGGLSAAYRELETVQRQVKQKGT